MSELESTKTFSQQEIDDIGAGKETKLRESTDNAKLSNFIDRNMIVLNHRKDVGNEYDSSLLTVQFPGDSTQNVLWTSSKVIQQQLIEFSDDGQFPALVKLVAVKKYIKFVKAD